MKASKFSDAQKAFILKRSAGGGHLPQGWDQPGDVLQLEAEVRRADADRDAAPQAARRGERQAEEVGRRVVT
jgi:hypothetical protein